MLNGLSVQHLKLNQDGDLEVEFDLPYPQTTAKFQSQLRGTRSFDVYEDPELEEACRRLFEVVRRRVMQDDPKRLEAHCDRCATSACCRRYNVLTTSEDIDRLAGHLGLAREAFKERFTAKAVDWSHDFERQLVCDNDDDGEEKCVFLRRDGNGQYRCSVYEHRPQICRDFDMARCDDFEPMKAFVPAVSITGIGSRVHGDRPVAPSIGGGS